MSASARLAGGIEILCFGGHSTMMRANLLPAAAKQIEYGSSYPMCECTALAKLTRQRTAQLRGWLDVEEGDACGGSRKP